MDEDDIDLDAKICDQSVDLDSLFDADGDMSFDHLDKLFDERSDNINIPISDSLAPPSPAQASEYEPSGESKASSWMNLGSKLKLKLMKLKTENCLKLN